MLMGSESSDIGKSRDRISKLEDFILCHILSFLPTKYAVGTSILSTRWRYLWTSLPNPNFDFDEFLPFQKYSELSPNRQDEIEFNFKEFVNRVLLLSDAACIQKLHLKIASAYNLENADTWIFAAIKRKVKEIELCSCGAANIYILPAMLFTSRTLVVLKLVKGIFLVVPASVLLPSLKTLHLDSVERENEESFQTLFLGCPVLEELCIERHILDTYRILNICVPTLKILKLSCLQNVSEDGLDEGCRVMVNAPKLEQLDLIDYVSEDFVVENLPSLLTAYVEVGPTHSRSRSKSYGDCIYKLLSGIKNVKFLDATFFFPTNDNTPALPTLHNLTRLKLGADGESGWNLLTDFLECSPNLEVLTFTSNILLSSAKSWSQPRRMPYCLLLHLEEIEIKGFNGEGYELEAIGYLLKNAKVLKKMTIDCRYGKVDKCFSWQKLTGIPRGSTTCLLNLTF